MLPLVKVHSGGRSAGPRLAPPRTRSLSRVTIPKHSRTFKAHITYTYPWVTRDHCFNYPANCSRLSSLRGRVTAASVRSGGRAGGDAGRRLWEGSIVCAAPRFIWAASETSWPRPACSPTPPPLQHTIFGYSQCGVLPTRREDCYRAPATQHTTDYDTRCDHHRRYRNI